jgi:hypothetical protein
MRGCCGREGPATTFARQDELIAPAHLKAGKSSGSSLERGGKKKKCARRQTRTIETVVYAGTDSFYKPKTIFW